MTIGRDIDPLLQEFAGCGDFAPYLILLLLQGICSKREYKAAEIPGSLRNAPVMSSKNLL